MDTEGKLLPAAPVPIIRRRPRFNERIEGDALQFVEIVRLGPFIAGVTNRLQRQGSFPARFPEPGIAPMINQAQADMCISGAQRGHGVEPT